MKRCRLSWDRGRSCFVGFLGYLQKLFILIFLEGLVVQVELIYFKDNMISYFIVIDIQVYYLGCDGFFLVIFRVDFGRFLGQLYGVSYFNFFIMQRESLKGNGCVLGYLEGFYLSW